MGSTFPSTVQPAHSDQVTLCWQVWPLVDNAKWSWLAIVGIVSVAGFVVFLGGSWLMSAVFAVGLAIALWQFFVPVRFEMSALELRRTALGRTRSVPWHAVRAYQLRTTGAVLYQQFDPCTIDLLRSIFLPYPADEDELICALRQYLPHAVELPV
jgi:hypothetical protein